MGKLPQAQGAWEEEHGAWDSVALDYGGEGAHGLVAVVTLKVWLGTCIF